MKNFITKQKIFKGFILGVILFIILAIIFDPSTYIKSASDGLAVWAINVIPSLFPFMFLSKLLIELNCANILSSKLGLITHKLYSTSKQSGTVFLLSILSGYPVGAYLTSELYSKGKINVDDCHKQISFCSSSGPLFVIGTVGATLLKDATIGIIIYTCHILASLLNGLIYRKIHFKNGEKLFIATNVDNRQQTALLKNKNSLQNAVYSSILSIATVGCFIVMFFITIDILNNFHILEPLNFAFGNILNAFGINNLACKSISNGLVEITRGLVDLSRLGLNSSSLIIISGFLISFSGLSIIMQSLTFLQNCHIRWWFVILSKATHAVICTIICFLFCLFFYQ